MKDKKGRRVGLAGKVPDYKAGMTPGGKGRRKNWVEESQH